MHGIGLDTLGVRREEVTHSGHLEERRAKSAATYLDWRAQVRVPCPPAACISGTTRTPGRPSSGPEWLLAADVSLCQSRRTPDQRYPWAVRPSV